MTSAWLGGFFDGEGCVQLELQRNGQHRYWYPRLVLTQKDTGVLTRVQAQFGGKLHSRNAGNGCSALHWCGPAAVELAQQLLNHTDCKHDQLLVLLESMSVPAKDREDWHDLLTALKQNIAA